MLRRLWRQPFEAQHAGPSVGRSDRLLGLRPNRLSIEFVDATARFANATTEVGWCSQLFPRLFIHCGGQWPSGEDANHSRDGYDERANLLGRSRILLGVLLCGPRQTAINKSSPLAAAGRLARAADRRRRLSSWSNASPARNRRDRRGDGRRARLGGFQPAARHPARSRMPPWACHPRWCSGRRSCWASADYVARDARGDSDGTGTA